MAAQNVVLATSPHWPSSRAYKVAVSFVAEIMVIEVVAVTYVR
jgi:hypothetical protein